MDGELEDDDLDDSDIDEEDEKLIQALANGTFDLEYTTESEGGAPSTTSDVDIST